MWAAWLVLSLSDLHESADKLNELKSCKWVHKNGPNPVRMKMCPFAVNVYAWPCNIQFMIRSSENSPITRTDIKTRKISNIQQIRYLTIKFYSPPPLNVIGNIRQQYGHFSVNFNQILKNMQNQGLTWTVWHVYMWLDTIFKVLSSIFKAYL